MGETPVVNTYIRTYIHIYIYTCIKYILCRARAGAAGGGAKAAALLLTAVICRYHLPLFATIITTICRYSQYSPLFASICCYHLPLCVVILYRYHSALSVVAMRRYFCQNIMYAYSLGKESNSFIWLLCKLALTWSNAGHADFQIIVHVLWIAVNATV